MDHIEAAFFYGDFTETRLLAQAILSEISDEPTPQDRINDLEQPS